MVIDEKKFPPASVDIPEISGLVIRRAQFEDADALSGLVTQMGHPANVDDIIVRLCDLLPRSSDYLVAVAQWQNRVVGLVSATREFHIETDGLLGRITAMCVHKDFRNMRIGAVLLAYAEAWLRSRSVRICTVTFARGRRDAHRFYQGKGYRLTGCRLEKKW